MTSAGWDRSRNGGGDDGAEDGGSESRDQHLMQVKMGFEPRVRLMIEFIVYLYVFITFHSVTLSVCN